LVLSIGGHGYFWRRGKYDTLLPENPVQVLSPPTEQGLRDPARSRRTTLILTIKPRPAGGGEQVLDEAISHFGAQGA